MDSDRRMLDSCARRAPAYLSTWIAAGSLALAACGPCDGRRARPETGESDLSRTGLDLSVTSTDAGVMSPDSSLDSSPDSLGDSSSAAFGDSFGVLPDTGALDGPPLEQGSDTLWPDGLSNPPPGSDGGGVTTVATIAPSPPEVATLESVSCSTPGSCFAVGGTAQSPYGALIEEWDGTTWSLVPTPNTFDDGSNLTSVACTSPTSCVAVGDTVWGDPTAMTGGYNALIESWSGTAWSITGSPCYGNATLNGVACMAASCHAVGTSGPSLTQPLVLSASAGSWSVMSSYYTNGYGSNEVFASVAYATPDKYVTVGGFDSGEPLTAWGTSAPAPPGDSAFLGSVACPSPTWCVAVGAATADMISSRVSAPFIESWNGSTWSLLPSPHRTTFDTLRSVACSSPTACTAVGDSISSAGIGNTLVETWNGAAWSIVPSPSVGTVWSSLLGVSCPAAGHCVAVGYSDLLDGNPQTLIEDLP
jgi:hypothetical protein